MIQKLFLLTNVSNISNISSGEIAVLVLVGVAVVAEIAILLTDVIKMGLTKNTARLAGGKGSLTTFISVIGVTSGILLHISQKYNHNSLGFFSIDLIIASIFAFAILCIMLGLKIANCVKAKKYFTTEQRLCDGYTIKTIIIKRVGKKLYKFYKDLPKDAKKKIRKFCIDLYRKLKTTKSFKKNYSKHPEKIFDIIKNKVIEFAKRKFGL